MTTTVFIGQGASGLSGALLSYVQPFAGAATIDNLRVDLSVPPGGATGYTITIHNTAGDTALECGVFASATTCNDVIAVTGIASGDLVSVHAVESGGASTTVIRVSFTITEE